MRVWFKLLNLSVKIKFQIQREREQLDFVILSEPKILRVVSAKQLMKFGND